MGRAIKIVLILLMIVSDSAFAGRSEDTRSHSSASVFTGVRLWAWVFSGYGGGGFDFGSDGLVLPIVGGSLGAEFANRYLVEGGGSLLYSSQGQEAYELFFRSGAEIGLWNCRDSDNTGWRLQLISLVGYRYIMFTSESDGSPTYEKNHCLTINAGLEIMRYSARGFGVGIRLLFGGSLPIKQYQKGWKESVDADSETTFVFDSYLALALAF